MMAGSVLTVLPVLLVFLVPAALLHPGSDGGEREGMRRRLCALRRRSSACAALLLAARARALRRCRAPRGCIDGFEPRPAGARIRPTACRSRSPRTRAARTVSALRLDFDFHGHGGYADRAQGVRLALPANYAFSFRIRGDAPPNNLEFKLIDSSGDNVWWMQRRDFVFPDATGRTVTLKKRRSPSPGARRAAASSPHRGDRDRDHRGSGWQGQRLARRSHLHAARPDATVHLHAASSSAIVGRLGPRPALGADGNPATYWQSATSATPRRSHRLSARARVRRRHDRLGARDSAATNTSSRRRPTAEVGQRLRCGAAANGGRDWIYLPETESR